MKIRAALLPLLLVLAPAPAGAEAAEDEWARKLHKLFDDFDKWTRREFPEDAMRRGDYSGADRLSDHSLEAIERRHKERERYLTRLRLVPYAELPATDQVHYDLFEDRLEEDLEAHQFRAFLAPLSARSGPHVDAPEMADHVRFESLEDYQNYTKRLEQVPVVVRETIRLMKLGIEERRVPPQVVMEGVGEEIGALDAPDGLERLARPFQSWPALVPPQARQAVQERFEGTSLPAVRAALADLGRFVKSEYLPACRDSIAAADWPDGETYYAFRLRTMTTTTLSPREVHELGLSEVARIRAEMMAVIRASDFMTLRPEASSWDERRLFQEFVAYLRNDDRFYHRSAEDLIAGYRAICKEIDGLMPRFFGRLPRLPYGVAEIPAHSAPRQTTAYYMRGDLRNHEAGFFYANTYDLRQRPKYEMIPLTLHEAVPGHHHQIALALEVEDLPEFRREAWFTAYGEGWALYAERLGIEMGLFDDPYDDFGRLTYEMWRACRLVVDPGMHALGWSRQKAMDFMLENTALSPLNIRNEIDRYIAWPGQACAYKIGELQIRQLRTRGEQLLGRRFDLRKFHDVILESGAVPLTILEKRVNRWIDEQRMVGQVYD